jgi:hypothetical protein
VGYKYGEIEFKYGDRITLKNGEVGTVVGFLGRGRNRVSLKLQPADNGNERATVIDATDVVNLERIDEV